MTDGLRRSDFETRLEHVLVASIAGCRALKSCERLSAGASQETYSVVIEADGGERRIALRRSPEGHGSLEGALPSEVEARLLQVAREVGVPEPEIYHVLVPEDGLGSGFLMEWIDGETLGARIVKLESLAEVRPKLARQCGEILARIHAIDLEKTGLDQLLRRSQAEQEIHRMWDQYKAMETPQPMIDFSARWLLEKRPAEVPDKLVHGEFRNGNLMITESGIQAVLDWEVAHIGDPAQDLGWLCEASWRYSRPDLPVGGFGSFEDLFAGYESVSGVAVDPERVHFWMVFGGMWWSVSTLSMTRSAREGTDRTIERMTIGRRSSEAQIDCANLIIPGPITLPEVQKGDSDDVPRRDELLSLSRDFLRDTVMNETRGRTNFLARVASNAIDIVLREEELGPAAHEREQAGLSDVLGKSGTREALCWELVHALRSGSMPLDAPGLADHLRNTVAAQIAIDQPRYPGLKTAMDDSA